nr:MAG TPA: hypothetical protein [Caudoviricetes sp.]
MYGDSGYPVRIIITLCQCMVAVTYPTILLHFVFDRMVCKLRVPSVYRQQDWGRRGQ